MLEMLKNTRLYIGTDTGPTHLAAILRTPMILFRNIHETISPDMVKVSILPIARREGFEVQVVADGWDQPKYVLKATQNFLKVN